MPAVRCALEDQRLAIISTPTSISAWDADAHALWPASKRTFHFHCFVTTVCIVGKHITRRIHKSLGSITLRFRMIVNSLKLGNDTNVTMGMMMLWLNKTKINKTILLYIILNHSKLAQMFSCHFKQLLYVSLMEWPLNKKDIYIIIFVNTIKLIFTQLTITQSGWFRHTKYKLCLKQTDSFRCGHMKNISGMF